MLNKIKNWLMPGKEVTLPGILPNFVVVGFGKCGTTSLHYALRNHPDICLVRSKEAHYFNNDNEYDKGLDYYIQKHFPHYDGEKAIGDITPAYVYFTKSLPRIKKALGSDVKIIVIMRHPVVRAFSHYIHSVRISEDKNKFLNEDGDINNPLYRSVSMYSNSLKVLYETFPSENILPLLFERDIQEVGTKRASEKIEKFIGVNHKEMESGNIEAAKGYLARVTVVKKHAHVELKGTTTSFNPGDVVIEHIRKPEGYYFEVLTDLSQSEKSWYEEYPDNITISLEPETVKNLYDKIYKEDSKIITDLTGLDVSVWSNVVDAGKYELVPTRLMYD
ncbi:MAG: sulfotransferase [Candidatus Thiodiazotropha sp. (ex Monitilora ramsayi)]|nr:sulfotransferase [Candidatus Thiodiazotropha sp. (ex Monitilora ramsayi)]